MSTRIGFPLVEAGNPLWRRVSRRFQRMAGRLGIAEPAVRYPFADVMQAYPNGYPYYRWGTLCAAFLGRALGYQRISVIEFGVAGGNGLITLEQVAEYAERKSGVGIDVYGFDTGKGLPKPQDYRDLPQIFLESDYPMDVQRLKSRLKRAQLVLGPVATTVPQFANSGAAPAGFVSFDLDLYSSTVDAFRLFDTETRLLPRVVCYFDDIIGFSYSEYNGERLAIQEFNAAHKMRKISPIHGLRHMLGIDQQWLEKMYMFHAFDHERYNDYDYTNYIRDRSLC